MALLEVQSLSKTFQRQSPLFRAHEPGAGIGGSGNAISAVDNVSLEIEAGETLGLVGESGSGKSTLGRLILRLIEATAGSVRFDGQDVFAARGWELRRLRRHMQIIFQDPYGSLNPRMKIGEILREPLLIHGSHHGESSNGGENTQPPWEPEHLLHAVGLESSALQLYPHEFSGGQRQRIGIARALVLRPKLIVCDEPVSSLDVSVGAQIVNLLAGLQRQHGIAYLFISHSMPVVSYLSHRIAVMQEGKIVETGATEKVCTRPEHPYTRALLEATPELQGQGRRLSLQAPNVG
jgi:ABC-type glutathione transport system ATPase component